MTARAQVRVGKIKTSKNLENRQVLRLIPVDKASSHIVARWIPAKRPRQTKINENPSITIPKSYNLPDDSVPSVQLAVHDVGTDPANTGKRYAVLPVYPARLR